MTLKWIGCWEMEFVWESSEIWVIRYGEFLEGKNRFGRKENDICWLALIIWEVWIGLYIL